MKIILASKSKARATMLKNAGIEFEIRPADIDETKEQQSGASPMDIAQNLDY